MSRVVLAASVGAWGGFSPAATIEYSIGNPTDEEQFHVELINRARANPTAEGQRLKGTTDPNLLSAIAHFGVDLNMMAQEFAALPARPPLAINAKLQAAARVHSQDMFTHAFQSHTGSSGSTVSSRLAAAGYTSGGGAENVFAYGKDTWYSHVGFQIDWGAGVGGMQSGRGHRLNIHGNYREIGVGVVEGTNTVLGNTVGEQVVTQNFGSGPANTAFVTGVVYHDLNGNHFYDPGEGVGGVTVQISGSAYHAVTTHSGGYAVPVPASSATRQVTFSGPGIAVDDVATIIGGNNVKIDLKVPYAPPVISGPANLSAGRGTIYGFTTVAGAIDHEWKYFTVQPMAMDPAENLSRVVATTNGSYPLVQTAIKHAGTSAYHLAHPAFSDEMLRYPDRLIAGANARIDFRSRLGWATPTQQAKVQVSENGGITWVDVYSQAGTGNAGEAAFQARSVSLKAYESKEINLRFLYTGSGTRYTQTSAGTGWYIDNVEFIGVSKIGNELIRPAGDPGRFTFTPPAEGNYLLAVRPVFPGKKGPFGPMFNVTAIPAPAPTGYELWASKQETLHGLPAGSLGENPATDFNRDGIPNFLAYALDLDPTATATRWVPRADLKNHELVLEYRVDTAKSDVLLVPEVSTNLVNWFAPASPGAPPGWNDQLLSTSGTIQLRRASVPTHPSAPRFLRLRATMR
jgi:hypothetical protein